MGRRVRTRLYFTSESHLHTLLNVLRFAKDRTSVLSEQGVSILNGTNELCYLTQVVIRLFEDNRWELNDARRFRVEILFSPGATATPLHMHEQDRDSDPSRFDTAPLEMIGRDGLTCRELEEFFNEAVMEGATNDVEADEDIDDVPRTENNSATPSTENDAQTSDEQPCEEGIPSEIPIIPAPDAVEEEESREVTAAKNVVNKDVLLAPKTEEVPLQPPEPQSNGTSPNNQKPDADELRSGSGSGENEEAKAIRNLERKYFWSTVAVGSFMLAASCLVLAMNLSDSRRPRKYQTRRL
jgi:hypothetical protein